MPKHHMPPKNYKSVIGRLKRGSKYRAVKTTVDGITFDSKGEAAYYQELRRQEDMGFLKIVELQPKIYLTEAKILYKPDFLIERKGELVYIDFKGMETPVFKLKARLWASYMDEPLEIVKRSGKRFKLVRTIIKEPNKTKTTPNINT